MLSLPDWWLTGRILVNLARFWPELKNPVAPVQAVPEVLGPYAVLGRYAWRVVDSGWGRATLPLVDADEPLPVVIFSGGGADDGTGYPELAQHWASHGLAVLQPVHADAFTYHYLNNPPFWAWKKTIWDVWGLSLGDLEPWRERARDIVRVLDNLPDLERELDVTLDTERIGAGGYSYGAQVALHIGGASFPYRGRKYDLRDRRIRACLAMTPEAGGRRAPRGIWSGLDTPTLWLTGDRDQDVQGRGWKSKGTGFRFSPPGEKWLALIHGANHFAFIGRMVEEAKEPADLAAQTAIFEAVKGITALYWLAALTGRGVEELASLAVRESAMMRVWGR